MRTVVGGTGPTPGEAALAEDKERLRKMRERPAWCTLRTQLFQPPYSPPPISATTYLPYLIVVDYSKWDQPPLFSINELQELTHPRVMSPPASGQYGEKEEVQDSFYTSITFCHRSSPIEDLWKVTRLPCYWGDLDKHQAELLLQGQPNGTFLLRNSSQEGCAFAVTFRRRGRTRHARVQYRDRYFSFPWGSFHSSTIAHLLEHYNDPKCCTFFEPLLAFPLSRPTALTLQELCRATVNSAIAYETISQLPLPRAMKEYLLDYHYKEILPGSEEDLL
ncbi:suppressor of cytokine signaling 4-like [Gastrophryne carolinensis]